jgi:hypothetical protein
MMMRMEEDLNLDHLEEEEEEGEEGTSVDLLLAVCPSSINCMVSEADGRMLHMWEKRSLVERVS